MEKKEHSRSRDDGLSVSQENTKHQERRLGIVGVTADYLLALGSSKGAVRRLVNDLGSKDEETSMGAYMALVKLGKRAALQLVEEANKGNQSAAIVQILGDQGDPSLVPVLEDFAKSTDEDVAKAAHESLRYLSQATKPAEGLNNQK